MKPYYIGTVRFSNETFQENKKWRDDNNWDGCIYGSPIPIAKSPYWRKVDMGAKIFILEMNNEEDRIEGIGCIKNYIRYDLSVNIYNDCNYNRYIYRSIHRKDRKDIENQDILKFLETLVFKGKGHLKRSQGISMIPIQWSNTSWIFPFRMLRSPIMKELKNGHTSQDIIDKYRKLHLDLFNFLHICFK
jgi:hypothetical protein